MGAQKKPISVTEPNDISVEKQIKSKMTTEMTNEDQQIVEDVQVEGERQEVNDKMESSCTE